MGCCHGSPNYRHRASPRRPRARICLRKGCGQKYLPRRWNQHYCQDPQCLREVRRWQAAKRQARRRQDETVKTQHADAQRARRQRTASSPQPPKPPVVAAARGHAAKFFCLFFCATGPVAMNRPPSQRANRCVSAAPLVARRFAGSTIVNASGGCAALSKVVTPASVSTPPLACGSAVSNTTAATPHHPRHRRDPILPWRRSTVCCLGPQAL